MSRLRYATSVIATRGQGPDLEVLLVERAPKLHFFGGYWAFPGGVIEDFDRGAAGDSAAATSVRCAIRELVKETNLVAAGLDGAPGTLREIVRRTGDDPEARSQWRGMLDRARIDGDIVSHLCGITTPAFMPIRYETEFVHVKLGDHPPPDFDITKIVRGEFIKPAAAIDDWRRGKRLIVPPILYFLEVLAQFGLRDFRPRMARAAAGFAAGDLQPIWFSPGILLAPLATPTLPPATTTNCLIVGHKRAYIVDPATYDERERQRLFDRLDEYRAGGGELCGILLTHHHHDHIGSVAAISRRYGLPVHAHDLTYAHLRERSPAREKPLHEGDRITLGVAPDGSPDWHLKVLHTPGHARDHLCFIDSRYGAAIVGDMLSTVSTILIDPPEGHMRTYLASLGRLLDEPITTLYPAHGPAHRNGHALIRHYLIHRRQREKMILDALDATPQTLEAIVPKAYRDTAPELYGVAVRSLYAGLEKLAEDGAARETATGWVATGTPPL